MRQSSRIKVDLVSGLVKCPSEEKIVVPLRAVLTTKWPQQQKWENDHFVQAAAVRAPDVHTSAEWATSEEIEASVWHGIEYGQRMLTRLHLGVNPHREATKSRW
jgi:hypothetical protein